MAKRVRVFFINCPNLATEAAAFLVLAQNKVQSVLQFEVYHFWLCGLKQKQASNEESRDADFRRWRDLDAAPVFRDALRHKVWYTDVKAAIDKHDDWLQHSGYSTYDCKPAPTIIVTETPLVGDYLSFSQHDLAVVTVAQWEKYFAPPSAVEFVLNNVQRIALRLCFGKTVGSHYPTRGCMWDFNVHQQDARIGTSLGWLCETCKTLIRQQTDPSEFQQLEQLISGEWIGSTSTPGSVAYTIAQVYSFDLTRTKGLRPGFWSFLPRTAVEEITKASVDVIKWVTVLLLSVYIASHFPTIAAFLKK